MKIAMAVAGLVCFSFVGTAFADPVECESLWIRRNAIYKEAGYCFKTPRAIREFGNAGCKFDQIDDVPLSNSDRSQIDRIVQSERALGCSRYESSPPQRGASNSRCRVTDPTGTPLKVRSRPYGTILGTINNGALVSIVDTASDSSGKPWVNIVRYESGTPLGWVYREFLSCF